MISSTLTEFNGYLIDTCKISVIGFARTPAGDIDEHRPMMCVDGMQLVWPQCSSLGGHNMLKEMRALVFVMRPEPP